MASAKNASTFVAGEQTRQTSPRGASIATTRIPAGKESLPQRAASRTSSLRHYQRLFETAAWGILIGDASTGVIVSANPALARLLGCSPNELQGRLVDDIFAETDRPRWRAGLRKAQQAGQAEFERLELQAGGGRRIAIECSCCVAEESGGKMFHCLVREAGSRNVTEEKLQKALRQKDLLLREVQHRVKNNLQIIHSILSLQSRFIQDEQTLELYRESQNRVRSLALIHEELYRSNDFTSVDFAEYLRKVATNLARSYGASPDLVRVEVDAARTVLGIDTAVPCGLLVSEILSNALKHAFLPGRRGEIHIELRPEGERHYYLVVRDNGIGLPPELDVRKAETLGLQLIATLVDQLGASLDVTRDGGTEFRIGFAEQDYPKKG